MELFKRDTLKLAAQGKLSPERQLLLWKQYKNNLTIPAELWSNCTRIALFALNRIRGSNGWPRSLPADTLQDCLQTGTVAAVMSLDSYTPAKGGMVGWIMANAVPAMREYAWAQVKAGIPTREAVWIDGNSLGDAERDYNDEAWLSELSYETPPLGLDIPSGEPNTAGEVREHLSRALGRLGNARRSAVLDSFDNTLVHTNASKVKVRRAVREVLDK